MGATKQVMTSGSAICNPCFFAFNNSAKKGLRPNVNVLLASLALTIPPEGSGRASVLVTRNVYEALGRGEVVTPDDVERLLTHIRFANGLGPLEHSGNRKIMKKLLMDVLKTVSDVCARDGYWYKFGDDGKKRYIYVMVMLIQSDVVIKLGRDVHRGETVIQHLQR